MATHNAPKHDFAPAWLKIPAQDNPKPSGSKQADSGSDKSRRHSGSSSGKYRHHPTEEDYYPYPPYGHYGYYNGYGIQYGSQSSMFRSPGRDPKYQQHPGIRYNQMNGGYPGYYDLYPFDYYGDPYYPGYQNSRASSKRSHYERDGRSNSKEGKEAEKSKGKETEEKEKTSFQDDFPSLNGEESTEKAGNSTKVTNGGSVWEHPPHGKMGSSKFGDRATANMYKALVPNKGNIKKPAKDGIRFNGGFPKDPFSGTKSPLSPTNSGGQNKEGSRQSPTPPIDILNTRLVTQPRTLSDKKSDFWKALRKGSSVGGGHDQKAFEDGNVEKISNGVETIDFSDAENGLLSSSLEAEQRLLKSMGWNEADVEEYEITEDEKKKFQERFSKQVPQQKEASRVLHNKALSPKHIMYYRPNEQDQLNDTLSSSDSEEESSH
ncbi:vasculin-like protein 1 isoform X1 [Pecten maximus]|uniref:vasculin-like protein 1 isoform X1 n=1 Tax=Pecten maximus TaxID=6579 RepID=UPI001458F5BE|nr:vasculin-like protein 1 isoform X1 [Pecten maximus]